MWGEGQFFYGPLHGKRLAFHGRPPETFRGPIELEPRVWWVTNGEGDEYPPLREPKIAEYRVKTRLDSGLAIYEYIVPTKKAEVSFVIEVPETLSDQERGEIVTAAEEMLRLRSGVKSIRLHYTGPVR